MRGRGRREEQENLHGGLWGCTSSRKQVFSKQAGRERYAGEGPSVHKSTWGPRGAGKLGSRADLPVKHGSGGKMRASL